MRKHKHKWMFRHRGGSVYWFTCVKCEKIVHISMKRFWGGPK